MGLYVVNFPIKQEKPKRENIISSLPYKLNSGTIIIDF